MRDISDESQVTSDLPRERTMLEDGSVLNAGTAHWLRRYTEASGICGTVVQKQTLWKRGVHFLSR